MRSSAAVSSSACACGRLRRATRALTQLYDDLMAPSGLRITQFSLLRTLARDGTARISDLADTLLLDRTALSRTLERTREVSLTRAGEKALSAALPHWKRAQLKVASKLGPDRLEALIATLGVIEALHPDPGGRAR
ncbi:MAG: winged helix-turn-helix transcriptional regulator [Betaproteobacteria bacterium]|nr:MAG: winged helix-turn-helix transcriptional regulator [Betaproteobacteria bacterium]